MGCCAVRFLLAIEFFNLNSEICCLCSNRILRVVQFIENGGKLCTCRKVSACLKVQVEPESNSVCVKFLWETIWRLLTPIQSSLSFIMQLYRTCMQIFAVLLKLFAFTFRRYNEFFVLQSKLKEFHGTITILFEGIDSGTYSKKWLPKQLRRSSLDYAQIRFFYFHTIASVTTTAIMGLN